jgi:hypothetical protein
MHQGSDFAGGVFTPAKSLLPQKIQLQVSRVQSAGDKAAYSYKQQCLACLAHQRCHNAKNEPQCKTNFTGRMSNYLLHFTHAFPLRLSLL